MGRSTLSRLARIAILAALVIPVTSAAASRLNVGINQSVRLGVPGVAANVVISNTSIADVTVVDSHSVIVLGKSYGATQIMVMDNVGHILMDSVVTVTSPSEGQMTLYRGSTPQQFNCSPRCEVDSSRSSSGGGAASSAPPS